MYLQINTNILNCDSQGRSQMLKHAGQKLFWVIHIHFGGIKIGR